MHKVGRLLLGALRHVDRFLHQKLGGLQNPSQNPLWGDRAIEYAFVIQQVAQLPKTSWILDVGAAGSPLTTILVALGFRHIQGVDILPSPIQYPAGSFVQGDFLKVRLPDSAYDAVIFCSSIEHFGLGGRYRAKETPDADVEALLKARSLLRVGGQLILTIPYGRERTIAPYHKVYNGDSALLREAQQGLVAERAVFYYKSPDNVWVPCNEAAAGNVTPGSDRYALGLFAFRKREA